MVWISAALGVLFGIFQARRRKGSALDMAQWGAVWGIIFALVALVINVAIVRQGIG